MLLEKTLRRSAGRATHNTQRAVRDVRQYVARYLGVVGDELLLGKRTFAVDNLVRMRDARQSSRRLNFGRGCGVGTAFARTGGSARIWYSRRGLFSNDFGRRLILSQTFEGSLAHQVIGGPGAEGDLPHELRFHPQSAAALRACQ